MKIEYTEDGIKLFQHLSNVEVFGHLTLDGFLKRVEYVVEHNDYIMGDPNIQKMLPMISPHLLLYTDGEIFAESKMAALSVRPAIVYETKVGNEFWLDISDDQMVYAINNSSILDNWLMNVDIDRWSRLRDHPDYKECDNIRNIESQFSAISFPRYSLLRAYSEDIPCADLQKHVFAKHTSIRPLVAKYNQKRIPLDEIAPDDDDITTIGDLLKVATVSTIRWNRKYGSYMDGEDCFYAVYTVPTTEFYNLVGYKVGQRIHDELYHRHFMVDGDDKIVLGWVRYQVNQETDEMMINEIQSRLRHDGIYRGSHIEHPQWKKIEQNILNNFLILADHFYDVKSVYLPTVKFIQQNSEGTPGEVYHRFPKQIGFKSVIADNIGVHINGHKCWKLDFDFHAMTNK
ncbi:MAG: hypothetical protein JXR12_05365 [Neptunomonas phycophila]|uniref:hypothetical protein n=1 Tax=Neptunomonas phycophila TaxID=1572645 RepID=UPI003B8E4F64